MNKIEDFLAGIVFLIILLTIIFIIILIGSTYIGGIILWSIALILYIWFIFSILKLTIKAIFKTIPEPRPMPNPGIPSTPRPTTSRTTTPRPTIPTVIIPEPNNYNLEAWLNEQIEKFDNYNSLRDVLVLKKPDEVNYADLLNCFEWKFKRFIILLNNDFNCNSCGEKSLSNHVHHNYYLRDQLPWDIDNSALEVLCFICHRKRHEQETIPVYKNIAGELVEVGRENPRCTRCGGTGRLPQFNHVENGICFKCRGNLINQTVFSKVLNVIFDEYYNVNSRRKEYQEFFKSISTSTFVKSIPNYKDYELRNEELDGFFSDPFSMEDTQYSNDDLPF